MLAWLSLVGAVLAFGTASLLQAKGARRSTEGGGGLRMLLALARSGLYTAGTVLDLGAVFLTAYALRDLPLFLVQAATSAALVVTAIGSALLFPHEHRKGNWWAILAVTGGLALVGSSAAEGAGAALGGWRMVVLASGVPVLLVARFALERLPDAPLLRHAVLAGCAYAGMAISLRTLHVPHNLLLLVREPAAWTAAGYLAIALLFLGKALQQGAVTQAMAIIVTIDTVVPAAIGAALLGDRTRPGWAAIAVVGLVVTVVGVQWLMRTLDDEAASGLPDHTPDAAPSVDVPVEATRRLVNPPALLLAGTSRGRLRARPAPPAVEVVAPDWPPRSRRYVSDDEV